MKNALSFIKQSSFLRHWIAVFVLALLSACAGPRLVEHGIFPEVKGTQTIYDIQVLYGKEIIKFGGMRPPGSGGGWNAPMPIPEKMTVRWIVDGIQQEVTIPIRDKLPISNPLENWYLRFYGNKLELWREELIAPPGTPTGLRPRKLVQVFP